MKKHIQLFLVVIIALFATNTFAQKSKVAKPKLTIEQKAIRNADSLKVRLGLSDIQYAKVVPINVEFFKTKDATMKAMKTDTVAANASIYKSQIKTAFETRKKAINAFLTTEQKATWKAWRKSHIKNAKTNKVKPSEDDIDANEPE
ncbi:MAG TPA: hypothetical protein PK431_04375 [Chitinophagales bacterium]|nr:hypothetical protein [Chitinophagales bacterium]